MLDQVRQFIEEHQLFTIPTDTVLVAVSGGLDSIVLLDVLHRLEVPVAVAHCHFG
ncbi:MAG: tRNA(Ile)-lysidine synthetase, partial [Hymenobacter sp.]